MPFVLAILVAGLWAAFMLPAFFDDRGRGPKASTRDYAKRKRLLGELAAAEPEGDAYVRHHAQLRRQRILIGLGVTAFLTLVVATITGSVAWLSIAIAADITIAAFVALLLYTKQQASIPRAAVVPIGSQRPADTPISLVPDVRDEQTQTVKVIAG